MILAFLGAIQTGLSREPAREVTPAISLRVSGLLELAAAGADASSLGKGFPWAEQLLGPDAAPGEIQVTAFEENVHFVYIEGEMSLPESQPQVGRSSTPAARPRRRVLFLKPGTFIVDDEYPAPNAAKPPPWRLYSATLPLVRSDSAHIQAGEHALLCETLLPQKVSHRTSASANTRNSGTSYLEIKPKGSPSGNRFLHVIHVRKRGSRGPHVRSKLTMKDGWLELVVPTGKRILRLRLPAVAGGAGEIAISSTEGKALLANRPLPSGILPHSPEGIRLLELWDADYRDGRHPRWDTGQPAGELRRALEEGTIRPGRAVELGCGTGTDAIYLASRGFEVTAIDISPSALAQAVEKARKASVTVRWMLADVLSPPDMGTFDFIYDRACYHEVRGQNLAAYLETVRRASRPGTRLLLLAGSAAGPDLGFGPPTVTEEELRADFLPFFEFEWLRESQFEINQPGARFPLAWSVLMRRKADGP